MKSLFGSLYIFFPLFTDAVRDPNKSQDIRKIKPQMRHLSQDQNERWHTHHTLDTLEVASTLPVGHGSVEVSKLCAIKVRIVLDHILAEGFLGKCAFLE